MELVLPRFTNMGTKHILSCKELPPQLTPPPSLGRTTPTWIHLLICRYLIDQQRGLQLPQVAGVAMLAAAAVTACMGPTLQWFQELPSLMHGYKIIRFMVTKGVSQPGPTKEMLFSSDLPNDCFLRYHERLAAAVDRPPMLQVRAYVLSMQ